MSEETLQTLGASARALFGPEQLAAFEAAFDRQAAYCRSKNYNEEGIPMFLVLEDVSSNSATAREVARGGYTAGRDFSTCSW